MPCKRQSCPITRSSIFPSRAPPVPRAAWSTPASSTRVGNFQLLRIDRRECLLSTPNYRELTFPLPSTGRGQSEGCGLSNALRFTHHYFTSSPVGSCPHSQTLGLTKLRPSDKHQTTAGCLPPIPSLRIAPACPLPAMCPPR